MASRSHVDTATLAVSASPRRAHLTCGALARRLTRTQSPSHAHARPRSLHFTLLALTYVHTLHTRRRVPLASLSLSLSPCLSLRTLSHPRLSRLSPRAGAVAAVGLLHGRGPQSARAACTRTVESRLDSTRFELKSTPNFTHRYRWGPSCDAGRGRKKLCSSFVIYAHLVLSIS